MNATGIFVRIYSQTLFMKKLLPFLLSAFSLGAHAQTTPAWTWANSLGTAALNNAGSMTTDAAGNTSKVTATDVAASNGLIHVIDTVVMP